MTLVIDTIEKAIAYELSENTGVTSYTGDRIYANVADQPKVQSEDPYIVIIIDEMDPEHTCDGPKVKKYLYYVDIYHENLPLATEISKAVIKTIEEYNYFKDEINIQESWLNDQTMAYNDEAQRHVYRLQFISRTIPVPFQSQ